jgi:hypothetical protein
MAPQLPIKFTEIAQVRTPYRPYTRRPLTARSCPATTFWYLAPVACAVTANSSQPTSIAFNHCVSHSSHTHTLGRADSADARVRPLPLHPPAAQRDCPARSHHHRLQKQQQCHAPPHQGRQRHHALGEAHHRPARPQAHHPDIRPGKQGKSQVAHHAGGNHLLEVDQRHHPRPRLRPVRLPLGCLRLVVDRTHQGL